MKVIILILLIQLISGERNFSSNETLEAINDIQYSHESTYSEDQAEFTFTLVNATYLCTQLSITSYLFAITYIIKEAHEDRTGIEELPCNETSYHGTLKMEGLEENTGNFLICVFFLTNNQTLITSSRFCHVISTSDSCDLEPYEATFTNEHVIILVGCAIFILIAIVIFTCIHAYIHRPRTFEEVINTLPGHHAERLRSLAPEANDRRATRRSTQQSIIEQIRKDSILTISHDPKDHRYSVYHGHDNQGLGTLEEAD